MNHLDKVHIIRLHEGNLSAEEENWVKEHLANCSNCLATVEEFRDEQRIAMLRRTPEPPQIPGYQDLEYLGEGGFGIVFKAWQVELNRHVALKMLLPNRDQPQDATGLRNEATALARLAHPNIVTIHEIVEYQDKPVLVLEFCEGGSLSEKIKQQPQDFKKAVEQIKVLAHAVQAFHTVGIVHRDLKPDNVLLQRGSLKISDFGLASYFGDAAGSGSRYQPGTAAYMAPEQIDPTSFGEVDPKVADVYALGAMLYEMLTGVPPFEGNDDGQVCHKILHEQPIPPSERNKKVPVDLESICLKCLKKQPRERYASANELTGDIERYEKNEPVEARRPWAMGYRPKKFLRRHLGLTAFVVLLVVGTVVSTIFGIRASENARQARLAEDEAQTAAGQTREAMMVLDSFIRGIDPSAAETVEQSLREPLLKALRVAKGYMEGLISKDRLAAARFGVTLGKSFLMLGQTEEAIEVLETALTIFEREAGHEDLRTLDAALLLAGSYYYEENWEKAVSLAERTFAVRRTKLGIDNADTLESMGLFAISSYQNGQRDQAFSLLQKAFERAKTKLGPYHPRTLSIRSDLALMYRDKGEPGEAVSLLEASVEEALKKFGVRGDTLQLALNLVDSYIESGRADLVVKNLVLDGDMNILKNNLGSDDPLTLKFLSRLIEAYQESNQFGEGDHLLEEWIQDVRPRTGSESIPTTFLLFLQGYNLLRQKQFAKAEPILRECLAVLDRKYPKNQNIFTVRMTLGEALLGQKKLPEAEPLIVKGYDGMVERERKLVLNEKLRLKRCLNGRLSRLVQLYEATGQKGKADTWRKKLEERKALRKQPK